MTVAFTPFRGVVVVLVVFVLSVGGATAYLVWRVDRLNARVQHEIDLAEARIETARRQIEEVRAAASASSRKGGKTP